MHMFFLRFFIVMAFTPVFVACSDDGAKQEATVIQYFEEKILSSKKLTMVTLTDEERIRAGDYSTFYLSLFDMVDATDKKLSSSFSQAIEAFSNARKAFANLPEAKELLKKAIVTVDMIQDDLQAIQRDNIVKKQSLKMSEKIMKVYDKAFDKLLSEPVHTVAEALTKVKAYLVSTQALLGFLIENSESMSIENGVIITSNPSLTERIQPMLEENARLAKEVETASKALTSLIRYGN